MQKRNTIRALVCAVLAGAAGTATAGPLSETFTYQGRLQEGGDPAAGSYDLQFRLFDAASGGAVIGNPISRTNQTVADGLFTTTVNFGGIGLIFDGERRWLEVSVRRTGAGSYTTLSPRQEVTATPYAAYAVNARTAEQADFALAANTSLDDAYENGRTIDAATGEVAIENSAGGLFDPAILRIGKGAPGVGGGGELVVTNSSGNPVVEMSNLSDNSGILQIRNAVSTPIVNLQRDTSPGGGGLMTLYRRDGSGTGSAIGFEVNGNWSGTEGTQVSIRGDNLVMAFDASTTGDNSARLGVDAINATEMYNEPGVAETDNAASVTLTPDGTANDTIATTTITAPASGYVLVIATAEITVSHVGSIAGIGGITSSINLGVSTTSGTLTGNRDVELRIDNDIPTGNYDYPITVHGLFPVNAGANTFYFIGDQGAAGYTVSSFDAQLTCVYLPTAYGAAAATGGPDNGDVPAGFVGGMSNADVAFEQGVAINADQARRDNELLDMYELIARMEARIEELERNER